MIHIGEDAPRWLKELSRFIPIKNLIFVHGDILDMITYPVTRSNSGDVYWAESRDPAHFFERYLMDLNYECIGFFDPVDGLKFPTDEMEDYYKKLQAGKPVEAPNKDKAKTGLSPDNQPAATPATPTPPPPAPAKGNPPPAVAQDMAAKKGKILDPLMAMAGIRTALSNPTIPCAFVFNLTSRLLTSPTMLSDSERKFFTMLLKASLNANQVVRGEQRWNNQIIMICDKLNDMPPFLYLNNPRSRSIFIDKPDSAERRRFIHRNYKYFYGALPTDAPKDIAGLFSVLTEGMSYYEMKSLINLSIREKIHVVDPQTGAPKINDYYHRL